MTNQKLENMEHKLLNVVVVIKRHDDKHPLHAIQCATTKTFKGGMSIKAGETVEIFLRDDDTTPTIFTIKDINAYVFSPNNEFVINLII